MKYFYLILFLLITTNTNFTCDRPFIIKIGAQIIDKTGVIITKQIREIELKSDDTYTEFTAKLLVEFRQTQLDSIITPTNLFLGDILKSSGLISKHHKDKLKPVKEAELDTFHKCFADYIFPELDGKLYPSANFSTPLLK